MKERFWEMDALRGTAILLMILFNWAFALQYLRISPLDLGWIFWFLLPRAIASMFIVIAGVSFAISYSNASKKKTNIYKKYFLRGGKVFCLGLLATAATWLLFPQNTIFFGILHFLGITIMIAPLLMKAGKFTPLLAAVFIATGDRKSVV